MSVWDTYEAHSQIRGASKRDSAKQREIGYIRRKLGDNLSYFNVSVIDTTMLKPGIDRQYDLSEIREQEVAIINSDNYEIKTLITMPGETVRLGDLVDYMGQKWIITEKDFNTEIYTKCKLLQCNYLLRWVDNEGNLYEQWSAIEDGTKYLTGEYEDRDFVFTRGDSRIAITLPRSIPTANLGRTVRFLVDEPMTEHMIAYSLTKPLKVGLSYGDSEGVYKFVCSESPTTDDDNFILRIADYYKYYDKVEDDDGVVDETPSLEVPDMTDGSGRKMWL